MTARPSRNQWQKIDGWMETHTKRASPPYSDSDSQHSAVVALALAAARQLTRYPTHQPMTKKKGGKPSIAATSPSTSTIPSLSTSPPPPSSAASDPAPSLPLPHSVASSAPPPPLSKTCSPSAAPSAASVSAPASSSAVSALPALPSPPSAAAVYDCAVCGKHATKACTICLSTHYCSKECQVEDWPKDKRPCKEVAAATKKRVAEEEETRSKAAREAVTNHPLAPFAGKASFETCKNCMATHYCGKACQVKHWPVHKVPCKPGAGGDEPWHAARCTG